MGREKRSKPVFYDGSWKHPDFGGDRPSMVLSII
jgi:hypothetical protein